MAKFTVEFNDSAAQELEEKSKKLETTKKNVIQDALSLYCFLVDELRDSHKNMAIISKENGTIKIEQVIVVPGLRRIVKN